MLRDPSPNKFSNQIFQLLLNFLTFTLQWWFVKQNSACEILQKSFLCSFKFRQLVLSCQINRLENPDQIFIGSFFEFLKPFLLDQRIHRTHLWEILKVIRAFGFFESDTNFRISYMQIKSSLKILKNPSFVEKSFVLNDRNTSWNLSRFQI